MIFELEDTSSIEEGDEVSINVTEANFIRPKGEVYKFTPIPPIIARACRMLGGINLEFAKKGVN